MAAGGAERLAVGSSPRGGSRSSIAPCPATVGPAAAGPPGAWGARAASGERPGGSGGATGGNGGNGGNGGSGGPATGGGMFFAGSPTTVRYVTAAENSIGAGFGGPKGNPGLAGSGTTKGMDGSAGMGGLDGQAA